MTHVLRCTADEWAALAGLLPRHALPDRVVLTTTPACWVADPPPRVGLSGTARELCVVARAARRVGDGRGGVNPRLVLDLLHAEYPGVRFDLPAR